MTQRKVSAWGQLLQAPVAAGGKPAESDRRAFVRYVCDIETTCRPSQAPDSPALSVRLQNISRGGVNLATKDTFNIGDILSVELPGENEQPACSMLACVLHIAPQKNGESILGCTFVSELNDEDLQPFGALQAPDERTGQRRWARFPGNNLQATYRVVRVTERKPAKAKVLDISAMGVGLLVDRAINTGTVLSVELHGASTKTVRMLACVVRATARAGNQWALGCNFIREISDEELENLQGTVKT